MRESFIKLIMDEYRVNKIGAAEVIVDWLLDHGLKWKFPKTNTSDKHEHISYCIWCRSSTSYPATEKLIAFFTRYKCTSCTPNPDPIILTREIIPILSASMQSQVQATLQNQSEEVSNFDLLEAVLTTIEKSQL